MNKQELINAIADRRTKVVELENEIGNFKTELAKHAEWQKGDIVGLKDQVFRITLTMIRDDASPLYIYAARKQGDTWDIGPYYLESAADQLTLIDRPEAK